MVDRARLQALAERAAERGPGGMYIAEKAREFQAECSPETVLALLAALRAAEQERDELKAELGSRGSAAPGGAAAFLRPPDEFWRPVPCGHPKTEGHDGPLAWWNGTDYLCHCGWTLDPERDGMQTHGAPGLLVFCSKCSCHVACVEPDGGTPDAAQRRPPECPSCRAAVLRAERAEQALRDVQSVLEDNEDWDLARNFARIAEITAAALAAAGGNTPPGRQEQEAGASRAGCAEDSGLSGDSE